MPSMTLLSHMIFNKKGFTLIELLVVIAIIGILASIVLVSFPSAQKKATDSRVVSAIAQIRTVMIYYHANNGNSYALLSCANLEMKPLCDDVALNSLGKVALTVALAGTATGEACVSAPLSAKAGSYYCADATGVAKETTGACVVVANTTARCP